MLHLFLPPPTETAMIRTAIIVHGARTPSGLVCSIVSSRAQAREIIDTMSAPSERRDQSFALCDATAFAEDGSPRVDLHPELSMEACLSLIDARFVQAVSDLSISGIRETLSAQGSIFPLASDLPGVVVIHDGKAPVIHVVHDRPAAKTALRSAHHAWSSRLRHQGKKQLAACFLPDRSQKQTQHIRGFAAHMLAFSFEAAFGPAHNMPRS